MDAERRKELGAVYTPVHVAKFLVKWAIRRPDDVVLDASAGEGIFIEQSIERLIELGADARLVRSNVIAVEYDLESYNNMLSTLEGYGHCIPKNLVNRDFFELTPQRKSKTHAEAGNRIPLVTATVGNTPYIERQRLRNFGKIRSQVLASEYDFLTLSNLTDIYGYFLIHLSRFLKGDGRLALIISDTWLNMRFGRKLKEFLLANFRIRAIVGFRERVFRETLVRTILLLAEKGSPDEIDKSVATFVELRDSDELDTLPENFYSLQKRKNGMYSLPQKKLDPNEPWSVFLKAPKIYFSMKKHSLITQLSTLADSAIGIQTLAKNFYLIDELKLRKLKLEESYFKRVAVSPRDTPLVIEREDDVKSFILCCDKTKEELKGTVLLKYIEDAEKLTVTLRGKSESVIGINSIPRLMRANRSPWYNLKTSLERWDRAEILLPRRIFKNYACYWNKAKVVENENFIRIYQKNEIHMLPLLAFLNSSVGEFFSRIQGNVYGGGVCDLKPNDVKKLRALNLSKLNGRILKSLAKCYEEFIALRDRSSIDERIFEILELKDRQIEELMGKLRRLRQLSITSKGTSRKVSN